MVESHVERIEKLAGCLLRRANTTENDTTLSSFELIVTSGDFAAVDLVNIHLTP